MTGRMLSERLGKVSFWLVFIGFHLTFLIQHSAGLSGMPRRIYEYDAELRLGHLQPDLDDRRVHHRARRAAHGHQRRPLAQAAAPIAGPDPWKANTLEWFTPSPPPVQQLRRRPARALGRADEGHPAPGRGAVRRRRSASRPAGRWWTSMSTWRPRVATRPHAARRRRASARCVADYVALTKPQVQSLLLLTTVTTMYVAGDPSRRARVLRPCLGGSLSAGGAGAVNHWFDRDIDAQMARTATRPVPAGRIAPRRGAGVRDRARRAVVRRARRWPSTCSRAALALCGLPRLRVRLHDVAQAHDAAEHRDRRRGGRRAAARRLGRGDRPRRPDRAVPVRDRLLLDAAALLGAVAADEGRVRARRRADDAGGPRRGRDAAADPALHGAARRC